MPSAQKPAGAEDAERALSRDQPVAADAAAPTPANQGSASAAGAEFTDEDHHQDPPGNGDLLGRGVCIQCGGCIGKTKHQTCRIAALLRPN